LPPPLSLHPPPPPALPPLHLYVTSTLGSLELLLGAEEVALEMTAT
jgi:hypothetical protein